MTLVVETKDIPAALADLAEEVTVQCPRNIKTRELLEMFGQKRRGKNVVERIEAALDAVGVVAVPEIDKADFYGSLTLASSSGVASSFSGNEDVGWPISAVLPDDQVLVSVSPEEPLEQAIAQMVSKDLSQIPVIDDEKKLWGTISWKSLGRNSFGINREENERDLNCGQVCEHDPYVANSGSDMLQHVEALMENDCIYIQGPEMDIVAILTAADVTNAFLINTGKYVKIAEIEGRVKALIGSKLKESDYRDKVRNKNKLAGVEGMTFGDYVEIFKDETLWPRFGIRCITRNGFVDLLEATRVARNSAMHFHANRDGGDGASGDDECVDELIRVLRFISVS